MPKGNKLEYLIVAIIFWLVLYLWGRPGAYPLSWPVYDTPLIVGLGHTFKQDLKYLPGRNTLA